MKKKLLALSLVGVILVCSGCEAPKIPLDNDGKPIPYTIPNRYCKNIEMEEELTDEEIIEELQNVKVLYLAKK